MNVFCRVLLGLAGTLGALAQAPVRGQDHDLVLRHGRVMDGSGGAAFAADVAIHAGKITAVGKVPGVGRREIDVRGLVLCPGFIDVHTHAEEVVRLPRAENFLRMGVTTLILGNCGTSTLEVERFFSRLTNSSVNVATLIGQGSVRSQVMGGSFLRPPTEVELEQMRGYVDRAMKEGALGLSSGLIYLPGSYTKTDELIALARVAAHYDGIYASHLRNEGTEIFTALEEFFQITRQAAIRGQVSHIKLSGNASWHQADRVLEALERARAQGLEITQDQYVYTAASTSLGQLVPDDARAGGLLALAKRLEQPEEKKRIQGEMLAMLRKNGRTNYAYAVIASCPALPALNGLSVVEAARRLRGSAAVEDQMELVLELERRGGAIAVFHGILEEDLQRFLRHPKTMMGSDSGVREWQVGVPHPRGYGNNARVLARYVRQEKVLSLEEAVRRMTSLPAATFRLADRGVIRTGAWADLVVFDPEQVQDEATFENPHRYATGFAWVLVNGVPVVEKDQVTGAAPGVALRRSPTR